MRAFAIIALLSLFPGFSFAADKLTFEDRIELTRGLMAEYATARVLIPHSKKSLEFNADGTWDKSQWMAIARESGPAARLGDMVQITKIDIGSDRIELQLNGGYKGGRHWYDGVAVAGGMGGPDMTPVPISQGGGANAPAGTTIVILFHKPLEPIKAAAIKKMLSPVLDFEKHSVTEVYTETLPPEMQKAIKDKRVVVGMTHDQVVLAMGRPAHKSRETDKDGNETEDWVFGQPPGKITFVTFIGDKVTKVKEAYAGLGTEVADPPVVR
jgi:hypothetical protein